MAFRVSRWTVMRMDDPEKFRKLLLERLRKRDGNVTYTAEDMDVHVATVKRWIESLGIRSAVEKMRKS